MQLRRAVPLSLAALLASAGCVSVGPQDADPAPVRNSVPPAGAPGVPSPLPLAALPLGERARTKAAAPHRRTRLPGKTTARPRRRPAPPARPDELCAAAEGVVPPSVVDLCLRQYGR